MHPRPDEPLLGYARGIDRRRFARLRSGAIRPELDVDLHGLERGPARRALREAVAAARDAGARCLRVVHGRGLHSPGEAVLRAALPGWLAEPAIGGEILAFAPATPADGGRGATLVLLRRPS